MNNINDEILIVISYLPYSTIKELKLLAVYNNHIIRERLYNKIFFLQKRLLQAEFNILKQHCFYTKVRKRIKVSNIHRNLHSPNDFILISPSFN